MSQECPTSGCRSVTEVGVFFSHDTIPPLLIVSILKVQSCVHLTIPAVKMMREFVNHYVVVTVVIRA